MGFKSSIFFKGGVKRDTVSKGVGRTYGTGHVKLLMVLKEDYRDRYNKRKNHL